MPVPAILLDFIPVKVLEAILGLNMKNEGSGDENEFQV